ncbi:MAG TPA: hypothetical protein VM287_16245 [Egibacteraceae bacterium]|nr:hypothetical protein [Egibacteraceae bacterium]
MSTAEVWAEAARDDPRIYVACPLTCLDAKSQRQIKSDVLATKRAIESVTIGDRMEAERWLAVVYAPIDHTAPWKKDGLSPDEVYSRNLAEVHAADALIVIAENGGSTGVGQELEWAVRLGLPILYLTADQAISRQILGFIQAQAYGNDAQTLESHVKNFLRQWKPLILDGPRRRQSRELRYLAIGQRLRAAWEGCSNRTLVAAQVRVDVRYLELSLAHPSLLSVMPIETLVSLAHELEVDLASQAPRRVMCLPVPFLRALLAAAEADGWSDGDVERLMFHGRAAIERGEALDLATLAAWRALYDRL